MSDTTIKTTDSTDHATPHAVVGEHSHSDTVVLPLLGSVTVPGGIYTVVFVGLGILTLLEVILADVLKAPDLALLKGATLLAFAFGKAALVALFYMHLRKDSRIFAVVLVVPLVIATLCLLYLVFVPTGGGLGYQSLEIPPTVES